MVLIIGGMAQGKRAFAEEKFGISPEEWRYGLCESPYIYGFEEIVRKYDDIELEEKLKTQAEKYPDTVIICREVGAGIVPREKEDRLWRERVGRWGCRLAARSDEVYRVFCGMGSRIK